MNFARVATALHIRFTNLSYFDKETRANVWKLIETLCEEESRNVEPTDIEDDVQVHDWEQNDYVDDVEALYEKVDRYRKVKQNIKADPLEFWHMNEKLYPSLAKLARRLLNVPGTSVPSERLFSTTGFVGNKQRCSLSDENIEILC